MSESRANNNFDLIYYDRWISPVINVTGYKYYLVILDDCLHLSLDIPLWLKFDTFSLDNFFPLASTHFGTTIKGTNV